LVWGGPSEYAGVYSEAPVGVLTGGRPVFSSLGFCLLALEPPDGLEGDTPEVVSGPDTDKSYGGLSIEGDPADFYQDSFFVAP